MATHTEELDTLWPPPISTGLQPQALPGGKRDLGSAAAWVGGLGLSLWLGDVTALGLLPDTTTNKPWLLTLLNVAIVAGPSSALAGITLGGLGRRTRRGRLGLVLSLLVLLAMALLIAYIRYSTGYWLWLRPVKEVSCGCG